MIEHAKCPVCGNRTLEEHGTEPGDHHWWFCRECGAVLEDEEVKKDVQGRKTGRRRPGAARSV